MTIPEYLLREVEGYDINLNQPPATILDIGANVGAFSLRAAARWPDAKIFAYEPMPDNAAEFVKNCGNGRIVLNQAAVRGFDGVEPIRIGKNFATNSFHDVNGETFETIDVLCTQADGLPEAEFVKIDTEGCEVEILEHLPLGKTNALACEYHRAGDVEAIRRIAAANGLEEVSFLPHSESRGVLKFARPGSIPAGPRIFVAIPVYGSVPGDFVQSLLKLQANPPANLAIKMLCGDSLVARARNTLSAEFLKSDSTHMLFLDSDLIFSSDHIRRLIDAGKDLVAGFYPKKQDGPLRWVCNAPLTNFAEAEESGLQKMRYMGTGFMLIHRRVFEKMIAQYGKEIEYHPDGRPESTEWDFWSCGPYKSADSFRRYLSEDWFFCQRWLDMGGDVWGDTRVIVKHIGHAVYPLQHQVDQIANPVI